MVKVAIVGAGINGLTCGVKIKEKYPNTDVVIYSKEFTPNTTGDGCGGLWYPYLCGNTPESLLSKWGGETYKFLHKLWLDGTCDVSLMPLFELHREKRKLTTHEWATMVFGYRILEENQLNYLTKLFSIKYQAGRTFNTFISYPPTILAHLGKRFADAKGKIVYKEITTLDDPKLSEYDVIINCSGLGAKYIVPDGGMYPTRGQISRVTAPWINETIFDEDTGNYIIPNARLCVLGGTHQEHDYNLKLDDKDVDFVLNGCKELVPSLEYAKLINHWAGLRPSRHEVRLESEEKNGKIYIHNYGHGGSGFTLFWGCGSSVLELFEKHAAGRKSKL